MLSYLKNHPFAVKAFFEHSTVLSFAVPRQELAHMLPGCLEPDTFQDHWGFVALAMVQTRDLRPKGLPAACGNNFFLMGWRIFVRYTSVEGKRLRGLYILRSQTDRKKMEILGNVFTHYNYSTTDISRHATDAGTEIRSEGSDFRIVLGATGDNVALPQGSPFHDWKEARRFAGPLPFTFSYVPKDKQVIIVEGVRQNWKPEPAAVLDYDIPFLAELGLKDCRLANAFVVRNIPYEWKKGRKEQWSR